MGTLEQRDTRNRRPLSRAIVALVPVVLSTRGSRKCRTVRDHGSTMNHKLSRQARLVRSYCKKTAGAMRSSRNAAWFQIVQNDPGPSLCYNGRLAQLVQQMASPATQRPGLVCFLGRRGKNRALHQLLPDCRTAAGDDVCLQLDGRTYSSDHPILVADCDPNTVPVHAQWPPSPQKRLPIGWAKEDSAPILDIFLSRLVFPFAHVVCVFANDVGGLDGVQTMVHTWALLAYRASSASCRPRLLIVVETKELGISHALPETNCFVRDLLQHPEVADAFGSIHLLHLSGGPELSPAARYRPVKEEVLKALDWSYRDRAEHRILFSACHLNALFERALVHACRDHQRPFDWIRAARGSDVRGLQWAMQISDFLSPRLDLPWGTKVSMIASSLLVDAFPPGSHGTVAALLTTPNNPLPGP